MPAKNLLSRVLPISALILMILFKFQNCAPVGPGQANYSGEADTQVRIVDRWGEQRVSFLEPSVVVPASQEAVALQGLCVGSEKGQLIEYQVIELKDTPELIGAGVVECVMGGFELPLAQLHFSSCAARLQVRATRQGETASYAETLVQPACGAGS